MKLKITSPSEVWKRAAQMSLALWVMTVMAMIFCLASVSTREHMYRGVHFSSENVVMVDTNKAVPSELPSGLPIESVNITQSETLTYPDKGVTIHNLSYSSTKSMEDLYLSYYKYFTSNHYITITLQKDSIADRLQALNRNRSEVSVNIAPQKGGNLVSISYLVRQ